MPCGYTIIIFIAFNLFYKLSIQKYYIYVEKWKFYRLGIVFTPTPVKYLLFATMLQKLFKVDWII